MKQLLTGNLKWGVIFLFFALTGGCNSPNAPDCLKSAGEQATEERVLDGKVEILDLEDFIHLTVFEAETTTDRIVLRGPVNLLPSVETDYQAGRLTIRNRNRCNWVRDFGNRLELELYTSDLNRIYYAGQGDLLFADTLVRQMFTFENRQGTGDVFIRLRADTASVVVHTGFSEVQIAGEVTSASLFNQGVGRLDASQLDAQVISCNNSSINELHVSALLYLYAFIGASGNVVSYGQPEQVELERQGSGTLIVID